MNDAMPFSVKLRQAREAAHLTLAQLAERAGISKTYLWELEKDDQGEKSPSVDVAKRLASALSVSLLDLVGHNDEIDYAHERRERLVRRACQVMGWDYHTAPVWAGLRKVALAEAVAISLEKLEEMLSRLEGVEGAIQELDKLADLLADSEEITVGQTPAVARLNKIIDGLGGHHVHSAADEEAKETEQ